jgi:TRAP-type C4-dicarboxylate transport system permease small subunit
MTPADTRGFGPIGRVLLAVSKHTAIAGGLVFVGLTAMSLVSIIGRKLFAWPVPGDVELLQLCAAFASSAFFAYCRLVGGDVKVDFFTQHLAPQTVSRLDAVGSLLVGLFGSILAWRTAVGALNLIEVGETSAVLALPVWIAQMLMVPGFALLAIAGFYLCLHRLRAAAHAERR